jgi:hypothetical protein
MYYWLVYLFSVPGRELEGISKLSKRMLGRPVDKSQQCSDWSARPLEEPQLIYAGLDAWLLTQLFDSVCFLVETGNPLLPPPLPPPASPTIEEIPLLPVTEEGSLAPGYEVVVSDDGSLVLKNTIAQAQSNLIQAQNSVLQAQKVLSLAQSNLALAEDYLLQAQKDLARAQTEAPVVDTPALIAELSQKVSVGNSCLKLVRDCTKDYTIEVPDPVENFIIEASPPESEQQSPPQQQQQLTDSIPTFIPAEYEMSTGLILPPQTTSTRQDAKSNDNSGNEGVSVGLSLYERIETRTRTRTETEAAAGVETEGREETAESNSNSALDNNKLTANMVLPMRSMKMMETPMRKSWIPFLSTIRTDGTV